MTIISNQVECLRCGDKPFSAHRYDFKTCKCGSISVDGGLDYLRRVGNVGVGDYRDISIQLSPEAVAAAKEKIRWAQENGRNEFGILCRTLVALRDAGYEIRRVEG